MAIISFLRTVARPVRSRASLFALALILAPALAALGPAPIAAAQAPFRQEPARAAQRGNPTTSVQELVRFAGQARTPLRGIGLVTGLRGSGDSGAELALARPLAEFYASNGNPIGDLRDLAKAKSAALVTLWCEIPMEGGRAGDTFDVFVSASHNAASLRGGMLEISPMLGPLRGQGVIAFASGPLHIERTDIPTVGLVRGGAQLVVDVRMPALTTTFDLVVEPYFRSWTTTQMLADQIRLLFSDLDDEAAAGRDVAVALDDATVRITIPEAERADPANFLSRILTHKFSPTLIDLPAQVIVNERTGSIIVTGDVEISAVTVGNDKLVVTTVTPAHVPTPADPRIETSAWTAIGTSAAPSERARIEDLLEAFKQLGVPVKEQIEILADIHRAGRLHARFIRR